MILKILTLVLFLFVASCSTMQYTANSETNLSTDIRVLYSYPTEKYKNLGVIDFDFYKPGFREPTVNDALPKLKVKISEIGGNALIIRNQRIGKNNNRFITISAEVLKVQWSESAP